MRSRSFVEERYPLIERWKDADEISICAFSCGFFQNGDGRGPFEQALKNGVKFRIIINNPNSEAAKDAAIYKIFTGTVRSKQSVIPNAYNGLLDWVEEVRENPNFKLEAKITDLFLPCAIMIVKNKNHELSTIKIDYYCFNCDDEHNIRSVFISGNDKDNFLFYLKQFEVIWNNSTYIQSDI